MMENGRENLNHDHYSIVIGITDNIYSSYNNNKQQSTYGILKRTNV